MLQAVLFLVVPGLLDNFHEMFGLSSAMSQADSAE